MLLGIIADAHDNLPKIDAAVRKLNSLGVDQVLHAGDYCAPFAASPYKALKAKMHGVFGNNDAEREKLQQRFASMGHDVKGSFAHLDVAGTRIALIHGDDDDLLQALAKTQSYDLVVFGHTHSMNQSRNGKTIVLNPGEICGYLTGRSTIAAFDVESRRIEILEI